MTATRITGIRRGASFHIFVDGNKVLAYEGETLATVMLAAGIRAFSIHAELYPASRLYCGMGTCHQCLVTVNDEPNYQACRTLARPGMRVETRS